MLIYKAHLYKSSPLFIFQHLEGCDKTGGMCWISKMANRFMARRHNQAPRNEGAEADNVHGHEPARCMGARHALAFGSE
jgi:hypothetical protein